MPAPWVRRGLLVAAVIAVLVAVYAAAGFLGVPRLLRSQLTGYVRTHYHRQLHLGEIRFNPFSLRLEVHDIALPDAHGEPLVGVGALVLQLRADSVWLRGPSLEEIRLEQPYAHLLVGSDGKLNVADLIGGAGSPPPAPQAHPQPLRLYVHHLAVAAGTASYQDRSRAVPFRVDLRPIDFELRDFRTLGSAADAYALDFATLRGEHFRWRGTLGIEPFVSSGSFAISQLQARTVWEYLRDALPAEITSGIIDLSGQYTLSTARAPLDLRMTLDSAQAVDLALRARGGTEDLIKLQRIELTQIQLDLPKHQVRVGAVRLRGGDIRARLQSDGTLNLMALLPAAGSHAAGTTRAATPIGRTGVGDASGGTAPAAPIAAAATAAPAALWQLAAPDIDLSGLKIEAEDRAITPAVALDLSDIELQIHGFQSPATTPLDLQLRARIGDAGRLRATGRYALDSGAAHVQLQLDALSLTPLQPFVAERAALDLVSGELGAKLTIERSANGVLAVSGGTELSKLRIIDDSLQQDFLKCRQLSIAGLRYRSSPARLRIERIVAREPFARIIIASDRSINVSEALRPAGAASGASSRALAATTAVVPGGAAGGARVRGIVIAARGHARTPAVQGAGAKALTAASAAPSMPISVGRIELIDGSARYTDLWIQPSFALSIEKLSGGVRGISSDPHAHAQIDISGSVDRYAPVHIWGELAPFSATTFSDVKMSFHGLELTTITPYSSYFAGYRIEKGKLSLDVSYHIENGKLQADHHFVFDQLQLGEHVDSPNAMKLPLRLAVALLKDRNGVIDLPLPVTGSLDDPQFKVGPILWKAFVNLLEKAVTAPFALLGSLFGSHEPLNEIQFDPGSAALDAQDQKRLADLLKALVARPSLQLEVPSPYAPALDTAALRSQELERRLLALERRELAARKQFEDKVDPSILADPEERFRLLVSEYRSELGEKSALPRLSAAVLEAQHQKKTPPALPPAIAELQESLVARTTVSDVDLQALAQRRARAMQDALLAGGQIDPQRVFVLAAAAQTNAQRRIDATLGLK
ncbi:MAG TPA: DUF748 domain-containing protein [Steroidobacteraceae bacterium]|nr:DUF748 domain-containing protein [Steroidobacteraceae bacterium]